MIDNNIVVNTWNEITGTACVGIKYNNRIFYGNATCHENDIDMKSSKTGYVLAERRAILKTARYMRDCEIIPELRALKQLYYSMAHSRHFNPESYETKKLNKHIAMKEEELLEIRLFIKNEYAEITNLINEKDKFYKKIRENRK